MGESNAAAASAGKEKDEIGGGGESANKKNGDIAVSDLGALFRSIAARGEEEVIAKVTQEQVSVFSAPREPELFRASFALYNKIRGAVAESERVAREKYEVVNADFMLAKEEATFTDPRAAANQVEVEEAAGTAANQGEVEKAAGTAANQVEVGETAGTAADQVEVEEAAGTVEGQPEAMPVNTQATMHTGSAEAVAAEEKTKGIEDSFAAEEIGEINGDAAASFGKEKDGTGGGGDSASLKSGEIAVSNLGALARSIAERDEDEVIAKVTQEQVSVFSAHREPELFWASFALYNKIRGTVAESERVAREKYEVVNADLMPAEEKNTDPGAAANQVEIKGAAGTAADQVDVGKVAGIAPDQVKVEEAAVIAANQVEVEEAPELAADQGVVGEAAGIAANQVEVEEAAGTAADQGEVELAAGAAANQVEVEEAAGTIADQVEDEEADVTATYQVEVKEAAGSAEDQVEVEEVAGTVADQVELEEATETAVDQVKVEDVVGTAANQVEVEEVAGTAADQVEVEEATGSAEDQVEVEEVAGTVADQVELEEATETAVDQVKVEEVVGTAANQVEVEEVAGTAADQVEVEEATGTAADQVELEEATETAVDQVKVEVVAGTAADQVEVEEATGTAADQVEVEEALLAGAVEEKSESMPVCTQHIVHTASGESVVAGAEIKRNQKSAASAAASRPSPPPPPLPLKLASVEKAKTLCRNVRELKSGTDRAAADIIEIAPSSKGCDDDDDAATKGYVFRRAPEVRRPTVALGALQGTRSDLMKAKEREFLSQISGDIAVTVAEEKVEGVQADATGAAKVQPEAMPVSTRDKVYTAPAAAAAAAREEIENNKSAASAAASRPSLPPPPPTLASAKKAKKISRKLRDLNSATDDGASTETPTRGNDNGDSAIQNGISRTETPIRRPSVCLGAIQGSRSKAMKAKGDKYLNLLSGSGSDGNKDDI